MNEARFPSKERVVRDGVLIHAEGDDLIGDTDEAVRQGYEPDDLAESEPEYAPERVERDGVLVYAEGDLIVAADVETSEAPVKVAKSDTARVTSKSK